MRLLYHNVPVQPLDVSVAREYLFARFAWSVFPCIRFFVGAGFKRMLEVCRSDGEFVVREFTGQEYRDFYVADGRSGSASSHKRRRASSAMLGTDSTEGGDEERGRKRWRNSGS